MAAITIDKKEAMHNFFKEYDNINGDMKCLNKDELVDYLSNDIFIGVASAATGIPEQEFIDYAPEFFKV